MAHRGLPPAPPCLCFQLWVDDLCSPHPLTWGAQTPSRGTAVRTNRLHALPGTNTSLGSPGPYVEERENITLVKPSIKRKKSQSDNIKYSGSRPIMRFSSGHGAVNSWEVGGAAWRGGKKTRHWNQTCSIVHPSSAPCQPSGLPEVNPLL